MRRREIKKLFNLHKAYKVIPFKFDFFSAHITTYLQNKTYPHKVSIKHGHMFPAACVQFDKLQFYCEITFYVRRYEVYIRTNFFSKHRMQVNRIKEVKFAMELYIELSKTELSSTMCLPDHNNKKPIFLVPSIILLNYVTHPVLTYYRLDSNQHNPNSQSQLKKKTPTSPNSPSISPSR